MTALRIKNLQKTYANGNQALKGIDLTVEAGDFYALLGPNGAGKTTVIGIVTSLINKSGGEVEIFGHSIDDDVAAAKSCIGLVPQEINLNLWERVENIVVNQAGYYGLPRKLAQERAEKYLRTLRLWDRRNDIARTLSGGMKRRLMIARALVHKPKLLILDEPTAGVDIEIRRFMWDFLREINAAGTTIILTTHYLEEAESLCRDVAIIDDGRIIEDAPMSTVLRKLQREIIVLSLSEVMKEVPRLDNYEMLLREDNDLEVVIEPSHNLNDLFRQLNERNITVVSMRNKTNRLEELFMGLIEKKSNSAAKDPS